MTDKKGVVNIHGKEYMTVARRVELAHEDQKFDKLDTEVISHDPVVIKATVFIDGHQYTGISSVSLTAGKMIEKSNPYEVAETSAVGRALGFANYGLIESVASADEVQRAVNTQHTENGNLPERQIDEEDFSQGYRTMPVVPHREPESIDCEKCGEPATVKTGKKKNGDDWKGIFCSSGDRTHTKWVH